MYVIFISADLYRKRLKAITYPSQVAVQRRLYMLINKSLTELSAENGVYIELD